MNDKEFTSELCKTINGDSKDIKDIQKSNKKELTETYIQNAQVLTNFFLKIIQNS